MPLDFHDPSTPIGDDGTVGEFWQWAMSDMLNNRNRGILAEYLVGKALGADTLASPRLEWDCYDLLYGDTKIEVKSSAYVQAWHQSTQERSTIKFGVGEHDCWDAKTNIYDATKKRHADIYVFCVFPAERSDPTIDVLDVAKWAFYVITTDALNAEIGTQASIGITRIRQLCGDAVRYTDLKTQIDTLIAE